MVEVLRKRTKRAPEPEMTEEPCPRCFSMPQLNREMVQPMPKGAWAPLAKIPGGKPCCFDCASADTLMRMTPTLDFDMARIAVGNDRREQYRLPGAPMGLVALGYVKPSKEGDLEKHLAWLDKIERDPRRHYAQDV